MIRWLYRLLWAPDSGGEGGGPALAIPEAAGSAGEVHEEGRPGADPGDSLEADDPRRGWWAAQIANDVYEKHKDSILPLKGKHIGEILDDYFSVKDTMSRAIVPPGKDAKPEDIKAFMAKMGIPETADGYGFDPGLWGDTGGQFTKTFAEGLLKHGITKSQGAHVFAELTAMAKAAAARAEAGKKERAAAFDEKLADYLGKDEAKVRDAEEYYKRFVMSLKDKQLVKELVDSGIFYSPRFASAMAAYHKANNEEPPMVNSDRGSKAAAPGTGGMTYSDDFEKTYGGQK
jgi:hypothetical protein